MKETGCEGKRKNNRRRIATGDGQELVWIQGFRRRHTEKAIAAKASVRPALA